VPNLRAKRTIEEIRAARFMGTAGRRRRKLPAQQIPRAIERDYARALVRVAKGTREALGPLLVALPGLISSAKREREHLDAGEARRVQELLEQARAATTVSTSALEQLASDFGQRVQTHQRIQMSKQVRGALGADPFIRETGLSSAAEAFTIENVALIKDLPTKTLAEIEGIVNRGVTRGALHGDLAKEIQERLEIGVNRAKLIARDQVGKFYGNVTKVRQEAMGVTEFIWRSVGDERVRDEHVSLNGRKFKWKEGAGGEGIPGEPVGCRCYADPVLDDIIGEL
jgi:SPP1 gp7 family putative phage head morphogenesis protein